MRNLTTVTTADLIARRDEMYATACRVADRRNALTVERERFRRAGDSATAGATQVAIERMSGQVAMYVRESERIQAEISGRGVRVFRDARLTSQGI